MTKRYDPETHGLNVRVQTWKGHIGIVRNVRTSDRSPEWLVADVDYCGVIKTEDVIGLRLAPEEEIDDERMS